MAAVLKVEPRFQVWAENSAGEEIPVGPMACQEFAERYLEVINRMIIQRRELHMHNPHIKQVTPSTEYIN